LAHDPQLGRDVALKIPRAVALVTPELRSRFQHEARTAAGLDHPNIVPVYEAGEVGPLCYIASAYCPGPTLGEWLNDGILVWDLASRQVRKILSSPVGEVQGLDFSVDSRLLACACEEGVVLFDTADFKERLLRGYVSDSVTFSPDGRTLAFSCYHAGVVRLWNLLTDREVASLPVPDLIRRRGALAFGRDGQMLVTAAAHSVYVWNVGSTAEKLVLAGHTGGVCGLSFSPDGRLLVSSSKDHTVRIWDASTGSLITTLAGFRGPLGSVSFSPDGRLFATADWSGAVRFWHADSGREAQKLQHELGNVIWCAGFSPNGAYFAACGHGLSVWRVRHETTDERPDTRLLLQLVARPSQAYPITCCFNPTGDLLAWVESDHSLHLWDLEPETKLTAEKPVAND
jgi:WD40 repeat protein